MLSSITSQNNFLNPGAASPDLSFPEGAASDLPTWDKVNFQTLSSFERVSDQYQDWGLQFEGAIALTPSNPSFLSESDKVVLMPATERKMSVAMTTAGARVERTWLSAVSAGASTSAQKF